MVQQPQGSALSLEDYLIPLTTIRDTLLRPVPLSTSLSADTLLRLLQHHLPLLQNPARPFPAAPKSSSNLPPSITIPGTPVKLELAESTRRLAAALAERTQVTTTTCAVLTESFIRKELGDTTRDDSKAGQEEELLRLSAWFTEQTLAVPQIVAALQHASADTWNAHATVAAAIVPEVLGDADKYIERLFRGWSSLAQEDIGKQDRGDAAEALFRATNLLRRQQHVLSVLFLVLYHSPSRRASTSEGLVRGVVMSAFGTYQVNRDIWDSDSQCQAIATRIRDLTVIIGLEALCLNQALANTSEEDEMPDGTLLQDSARLDGVQQLLADQSEELLPDSAGQAESEPSAWPISVLCAGWSVALSALPVQRQAKDRGRPAHHEMAQRALSGRGRLWAWLAVMLEGPPLEKNEGDGFGELDTMLRKTLKDLLMGLPKVVKFEAISERGSMYGVFSLLFSSSSDNASSLLCEDFWEQDFYDEDRRAILDASHFPSEPTHLVDLLAALFGRSGPMADESSSLQAIRYFDALPNVTFATPPTACRFVGKDGAGRMSVEATKNLILPGGAVVPMNTVGVVLGTQNETLQTVTWRVTISGWGVLVSILRTAAGIQSDDPLSPPEADFVHLSATSLGIRSSAENILASGFRWLSRALDPASAGEVQGILASLDRPHISGLGSLVQLVLGYLDSLGLAEMTDTEVDVAVQALRLLRALLYVPSPLTWAAMRTSGLFAVPGKRKSIAVVLLQADASRSTHRLAEALVKLIETIASHHPPRTIFVPSNSVTPEPVTIRSALHFLVSDIWNTHAGWRYADPGERYDVSDQLIGVLDSVLRNPHSHDGQRPTDAAQYLIESFITSASPFIYRPLLEIQTQGLPLIGRMLSSRRTADAASIVNALESSIEFLRPLFRLAAAVRSPATALSLSLANAGFTNENNEQVQLIDHWFDMALSSATPLTTRVSCIKLLRTYLEAVNSDAARPSLAGMLRNAEAVFGRLSGLLTVTEAELQVATWELLTSVIATQPGCVHFAADPGRGPEIGGPLKIAMDEVLRWEELEVLDTRKLSAVLGYLVALYQSPSATRHTERLRKNNDFWTALYGIATHPVAPAPSFTLSLHADDLAERITEYAYATRAKASATAILAAELAFVLDSEEYQGENKCQSLVLALFRNETKLESFSAAAIWSSCHPDLHERQTGQLQQHKIEVASLRTTALLTEREYGLKYVYDTQPIVYGDLKAQSTVNLAFDLLNLNWSMIDADLQLTRCFAELCEAISPLLEGDGNAARAAQRVLLPLVTDLAEEDRGGDVMLSIQTQRLHVFAQLLDTALDSEADLPPSETVVVLAGGIRGIIENPIFPPIMSLRNTELAPIHEPVLRILSRFLGRIDWPTADPRVNEILECSTILALEAADLVFERVLRADQSKSPVLADAQALSLILGVLSEIVRAPATHLWLNRIAEFNMLARTMEAVVRVRIEKGRDVVPLYLPSVLLLHLALASQAPAAEKLAVSGVLPAYADNEIVLLAEAGKITPTTPASAASSVHTAWCGMLEVVKALLISLPPQSTAAFVKSDVVPFLRVCTNQFLRSLSWNGETRISVAQLQELELVCDVFFGVSQSLDPTDGTLLEFAPAAMGLLKSLRHVFSHPRQFLTLLVPDSEEEHAGLEADLKKLDEAKEPDLLDFKGFPTLADRTRRLLGVERTTLLTLVNISDAWNVLKNEHDAPASSIIEDETEPMSASDDPIGVLNDLHLLALSLTSRIPPAAYSDPLVLDTTRTCVQISEAALLVSTAQIILRHAAFEGDMSSGSMDVDTAGGRRRGDRREAVLRELISDVRGLTGMDDEDVGGEEGLRGWLGRTLELRLQVGE